MFVVKAETSTFTLYICVSNTTSYKSMNHAPRKGFSLHSKFYPLSLGQNPKMFLRFIANFGAFFAASDDGKRHHFYESCIHLSSVGLVKH